MAKDNPAPCLAGCGALTVYGVCAECCERIKAKIGRLLAKPKPKPEATK
jgi:hypothetical protein